MVSSPASFVAKHRYWPWSIFDVWRRSKLFDDVIRYFKSRWASDVFNSFSWWNHLNCLFWIDWKTSNFVLLDQRCGMSLDDSTGKFDRFRSDDKNRGVLSFDSRRNWRRWWKNNYCKGFSYLKLSVEIVVWLHQLCYKLNKCKFPLEMVQLE